MYFLGCIFLVGLIIFVAPQLTYAHEDGCHALHSCPSHEGSYECGDLGYFHECMIEPTLAGFTLNLSNDKIKPGQSIIASGKVTTLFEKTPIALQVFYKIPGDNATYNLIEIGQVNPAIDHTYLKRFAAGGEKWDKSGTYVIHAKYNEYELDKEFTFLKDGPPMENHKFEINSLDRGIIDIDYSMSGGEITNIVIDKNNLGFTIDIAPVSEGTLSIELPREWIDSLDGKKDIDYIVLIDGYEVQSRETQTNSQARTITIDFSQEQKQIQIIGTQVIPEFGPVFMILMISILFVIIASKNKIKIP